MEEKTVDEKAAEFAQGQIDKLAASLPKPKPKAKAKKK